MDKINIEEEIKDGRGLFFIEDSKKARVAKIEFALRDRRIMIEHTEVNASLSGKGIGKKLVDHAVNYARKHKLKVVPLCSFARDLFEKSTEYKDVK